MQIICWAFSQLPTMTCLSPRSTDFTQSPKYIYVWSAAIDLYSIKPAWNEAIIGLQDDFEFLRFQQCKSKPRTIHYYDALHFKMLPTSLNCCFSCRPSHSYRDWLVSANTLMFCKKISFCFSPCILKNKARNTCNVPNQNCTFIVVL